MYFWLLIYTLIFFINTCTCECPNMNLCIKLSLQYKYFNFLAQTLNLKIIFNSKGKSKVKVQLLPLYQMHIFISKQKKVFTKYFSLTIFMIYNVINMGRCSLFYWTELKTVFLYDVLWPFEFKFACYPSTIISCKSFINLCRAIKWELYATLREIEMKVFSVV